MMSYVWMIVAAALALGCVALTLVDLNVLKVSRLHERVFGEPGYPLTQPTISVNVAPGSPGFFCPSSWSTYRFRVTFSLY